MNYSNDYRLGRQAYHYRQEESTAFALSVIALIALAAAYYILWVRFHIRAAQLIELSFYLLYGLIASTALVWSRVTLPTRRERNWPHSPLFIDPAKDRRFVSAAYQNDAIVLGYDVHGKPWQWADQTRVMQSVVFGATGSGKTILPKK